MMEKNKLIKILIIFLFAFYSCVDKSIKEKRVMDDIVYELMPFKSDDNSISEISSFKFIISDKDVNGKIHEYFKPSNYNKLIYYVNKNLNFDFCCVSSFFVCTLISHKCI